MNKIIILMSCLVFFIGLSGSVSAATPVTGCGTLSTAGETYVLSNDINTNETCFIIAADDIILDGSGYSITGSWGADGVYVSGRSGVTIKNLNVNKFRHGIYLYNSSNNIITNNIASESFDAGIVLYHSSNNIIANSIFLYNWFFPGGIYLHNSSNNTVVNNNIPYNDPGILLRYSNYNIITDNTVLGSSSGISLISSNYNTISNNIAKEKNGYGIHLGGSNYNTIKDNTANSNSNGIYLISSNYNIIADNTANSNNGRGINLGFSSNYNTIINNIASNNGWKGIQVSYSSNYNTIYNNYFNNTDNFYFSGAIYSNWNTTKQSGTNIISGPYLGGNFWAKPDGTGFSETCTDADSDGICDSSYMLASGNVDYLPLTTGVIVDSDGDGIPDDQDNCPDTPEGATVDEFGCSDSGEQTVDESGGNVTTDTGSVTLEIPQDALTTNETITINVNESLISAVNGSIVIQEKVDRDEFKPLSDVYTIEPSGLQFAEDVNLTLQFNVSLAVDINEVEIYEYINGSWVPLGGVIEVVDGVGYITIGINSLNSHFLVLEVFDTDDDGIPDYLDACPLEDSTGFDADVDGCIDTLTGLIQVIEALPDDVLSDKIKNSLVSKVSNALKSMDKDVDNAAINQLNAFINEVEAQKGKKISEEAADMLIFYANNVIAQIPGWAI